MHCGYCGKEIDQNSLFCPFCGKGRIIPNSGIPNSDYPLNKSSDIGNTWQGNNVQTSPLIGYRNESDYFNAVLSSGSRPVKNNSPWFVILLSFSITSFFIAVIMFLSIFSTYSEEVNYDSMYEKQFAVQFFINFSGVFAIVGCLLLICSILVHGFTVTHKLLSISFFHSYPPVYIPPKGKEKS